MTQLPLKDITVLELGHTVMGPTCGLVLADMGASVYKIEPPGTGDETRHLKGFGSGFFTYLNRNKKSVAINLKMQQGKELFYRLVPHADVIIENYGPGTVNRLHVDYETCRQLNDKLIYCSLKGFMPGPYQHRMALDEVVQMMGGLAYMTGPTGTPLRAGASVADMMGGSYGVIGILAALYEREQTGKGKFIQASLYESVGFMVGQHMAVAAVTEESVPPMPERGRSWSVYDLFTSADGEQVFIGITSDRHWQRFCETFGFDDLGQDLSLNTNQQRIDARDRLLPELSERLLQYDKETIMTLADQARIPFAPVNHPTDLFDDPHMNEAGQLVETRTPQGTKTRLPKLPLQLDGESFPLRSQPPAVAEGSASLFEKAGIRDEEILQMIEKNIIEADPSK